MLRLSLLSGLAALTLFSGAAMADRLKVGEAIINASGPAAKFTVMECFRKRLFLDSGVAAVRS
jgi:hypothetical protein